MTRRRTILALVAALRLAAFEPAEPGYRFQFPRDHFEHPEFGAEWWYYTGNLQDEAGRRFGFELTFFRVAVERAAPPENAWDVDQVYLAHFAVSDIGARRFYRDERINRAGPGLAGASAAKRLIWNGNWSVAWLEADADLPTQRLRAVGEQASLDLLLRAAKPPVIHGEEGISRKAAGQGKASHYVSFTRLEASGRVAIGGSAHEVRGLAWMDHEFFTDSLGPGQTGWDWMSVQLDDGGDLMLYGMRGADGRHDAFSSGTWVGPAGRSLHLDAGDFRLAPGRRWRSGETGAAYPVEWKIEIPRLGYRLACEPLLDAQEVVSRSGTMPTYWEGAVRYVGERNGQPIQGVGYLEMAGYDKPVWLGLGRPEAAP